jgi:hypothetical protein
MARDRRRVAGAVAVVGVLAVGLGGSVARQEGRCSAGRGRGVARAAGRRAGAGCLGGGRHAGPRRRGAAAGRRSDRRRHAPPGRRRLGAHPDDRAPGLPFNEAIRPAAAVAGDNVVVWGSWWHRAAVFDLSAGRWSADPGPELAQRAEFASAAGDGQLYLWEGNRRPTRTGPRRRCWTTGAVAPLPDVQRPSNAAAYWNRPRSLGSYAASGRAWKSSPQAGSGAAIPSVLAGTNPNRW